MSDRTAAVPFGAISVWRAVAFVEGVVEAVRAEIRAARTRAALEKLTPRERADMGLDDVDARLAALGRR